MRDRDAFLLVFAVDDVRTYDAMKMEVQRLQRVKNADHPIMVVAANKVDLPTRRVDVTAARTMAEDDWRTQLFETSAKTRLGVEEAFEALVHRVKQQRRESKQNGTSGDDGGGRRPSKVADLKQRCCVLS